MMEHAQAFHEFKLGLVRLRDGFPDQALPHVRRAIEMEGNNPFYMSYLGLLLAKAEQRWADGEQLCSDAVKMKRSHPQLYLNLAEVYLSAGRKDEAIEALCEGMRFTRRNPGLARMLGQLGCRREPVFGFLDRSNLLNRWLGRLRHKIFGPPNGFARV
jgi:predicted Zn-dependent protease